MAVNDAVSVALNAPANAALNAVLLQIAAYGLGCCDQMLQDLVCTHNNARIKRLLACIRSPGMLMHGCMSAKGFSGIVDSLRIKS